MEVTPESIIVNSCQYTPVYLIPSPSVSQGGSYIITQNIQDAQKPITDNLKRFYENSGNLENSLQNSRPRILKRQSSSVIGNNLKLASFLLPKTENADLKVNVTDHRNYLTDNKINLNDQKIYFNDQKININDQKININDQKININDHKINVNDNKNTLNGWNVITNIPKEKNIANDKIIIHTENVNVHDKVIINKNENITKQYCTPTNQVIFTPVVSKTNTNVVTTVPSFKIDRKIVRVGNIPKNCRLPSSVRPIPKIKPEENTSKLTSVQLLRLGETYHSLNQLSDDQMKIVNKALKLFSDPEKIPEPAYDPVTNTKFIYKVVSPRDLTVVGKNKVLMKNTKKCTTKKRERTPEPCEELPTEPTVTRSGRTVKLPKQMLAEETPQRPKKRAGSVVSCYQCSADFTSLYRLQRHYESYPTHVPEKIHSNLFHCLLAIIKGGSDEGEANMFIQQLEQLIEKLKSLLPCLLKKIDGCEGKLCNINDDIGRLFGMNPGKYNLNMEALNCVKEKDGYCIHNPPPKNNQFNSDMSKPSQLWLSKHNEEIANNEAETEDCARIHSVDKWPTVSKRIWKIKQQKSQKLNAKKMRLASESEQLIELGMEDTFKTEKESAINVAQNIAVVENTEQDNIVQPTNNSSTSVDDQSKKPKGTHIQFRSTHFDIRSSPIKHSALVRKFQINPDKVSNYEVQVMRPLEKTNETPQTNSDTSLQLQEIFTDNVDLPKEHEISNELNFDNSNWTMIAAPNEQIHDGYMKSNILFEPTMAHDKDDLIEPSLIHVKDKSNGLFEQQSKQNLIDSLINTKADIEPNVIHDKDNTNHMYEPPIHIKTKLGTIIDSTLMSTKGKCNDLFGTSSKNIERSNSLFEPSMIHMKDESNSLFDGLAHVKERSRNLFEPTRSNSLFENVIHEKEKPNTFESLLHKESNSLYEPSMLHDKEKSSIESSLLHVKDDKTMNIDMNQSDLATNDNDSRLLSSQGQSVLNFLESLGNDCLAYPETEIRNNSVDFQLDLFSFNSS